MHCIQAVKIYFLCRCIFSGCALGLFSLCFSVSFRIFTFHLMAFELVFFRSIAVAILYMRIFFSSHWTNAIAAPRIVRGWSFKMLLFYYFFLVNCGFYFIFSYFCCGSLFLHSTLCYR